MAEWQGVLLQQITKASIDLEPLTEMIGKYYDITRAQAGAIAEDVVSLVVKAYTAGDQHGFARERLSTERRG